MITTRRGALKGIAVATGVSASASATEATNGKRVVVEFSVVAATKDEVVNLGQAMFHAAVTQGLTLDDNEIVERHTFGDGDTFQQTMRFYK